MDSSYALILISCCFLVSLILSLEYLNSRYRLSPSALWCPPILSSLLSHPKLDLRLSKQIRLYFLRMTPILALLLMLGLGLASTRVSINPAALIKSILLALWLGASLSDILWARIPNAYLVVLSIAALIHLVFSSSSPQAQILVSLGFFCFVFALYLSSRSGLSRAIGGGDVKALIPYLMSLEIHNLTGLSLGFLVGLGISILITLAALKQVKLIPLLPCLSLSILGSYLF